MAFYISPSVNIFESDFQSLSVVQVADYIGGTAGYAPWGPANIPTMITGGEGEFVTKFHKPDDNTYLDMLTAIDYMSYASKMWYVRVVGKNANNASVGGGPIFVPNDNEIDNNVYPGQTLVARYPGSLGNGLIVSIVDAAGFATWEFQPAFEYTPGAGEYSVAVVDGSGLFTGQGGVKQRETLSVYGTVNTTATAAVRSIEFGAGPATKTAAPTTYSLKINDNLGGTFNIGAIAVKFFPNETAVDVYPRIANAMLKQPNLFDTLSISVEAAGVQAVEFEFTDTDGEDIPAGGANLLNRITAATGGLVQSTVTFADFKFVVSELDTGAAVAAKFVTAAANSAVIKSVAISTGSIVEYTLVKAGAQPEIAIPAERQGITFTKATVTPSSNGNAVINVLGVDVLVTSLMSVVDVTASIAAALQADVDFMLGYENVFAERTTVHFTRKDTGRQAVQAAPEAQAGLEFSYGISTPGQLGTLVERFELQTTIPGDKFANGTLKNLFDTLRQSSRYVFWGDRTQTLAAGTFVLEGGVDDYTVSKEAGIKELDNAESIDANYLWIAGTIGEQKALADVVETRRDVVGHISPQMRDVVNNRGREAELVRDWRMNQVNRDSTYLFNTDNWALVYDKYNDVDRWIPICGGTAGLQARAAVQFYPWTNFSGHQRGIYKNYKRMAWSANKEARDTLYKVGVNSAVTFPGEGVVLYGDKMSTSRPSSFSRVNTRMAFIVAEKSLANFSRQYLFEVNDAYTRNQWLNAARPFLRNMQAGRAFEEFQLICDERNNGPDVRTENRMVGHIRIRPLYSINWIDLHFDAVRPGIEFDEVEILL